MSSRAEEEQLRTTVYRDRLADCSTWRECLELADCSTGMNQDLSEEITAKATRLFNGELRVRCAHIDTWLALYDQHPSLATTQSVRQFLADRDCDTLRELATRGAEKTNYLVHRASELLLNHPKCSKTDAWAVHYYQARGGYSTGLGWEALDRYRKLMRV